ncbi:hypothetical protein [Caballeronia calidae]|uniref:hypothetical protein n=1 Tax=Caballeronia calidae TaxID=1777139 RepID=UPI002FC6106E
MAHTVRSHWAIENGMHGCLDMAFGEEQCRVRIDNTAQNVAVLRRISMNLLRDDLTSKVGLRNRRLKALQGSSRHVQTTAIWHSFLAGPTANPYENPCDLP